MSNRHEPEIEVLQDASNDVYKKILERLDEKGKGIFVSSHEILGIVTEEYNEYAHTVHANNADGQEKELMDIAVAAIWGIVSIRSKKMDW